MNWISLSLLVLLGFLAVACTDHPLKNTRPEPCLGCYPYPFPSPSRQTRNVDLLFVVDNSGSMADEQSLLAKAFPELMTELRLSEGGLPNVHIGVTSTDLGTGMFTITYCEEVGGDQGNLLKGACANPTGVSYIVDVEPTSCEITKQADGTCTDHSCAATNCSHESTTSLEIDTTTGCPRCRNYLEESLEEVFTCLSVLGTSGCGFEQPLEAMYKALDNNPQNAGFVRENALLAVILVSDEDDCSASNPQLFDTSQDDISSTLGPITSFRCFEFGTTCDINQRTHQGLRQNCVPREDPGALLHPVSRYIQFLHALKDPALLTLSAIAGPASDQTVQVGLDEYNRPEIQPSCESARGGAAPGIRLQALVEAFQSEEDLAWAYTSICQSSYTAALQGVGQHLRAALAKECHQAPLAGCPDIGAEYGAPADDQLCNDRCQANCQVTDIFERGTANETRVTVPPCLEICPSGPCPGNTDRSLAYAQGHPAERDPDLPVGACWHVTYEEHCQRSNFAAITVSRQTDPPPRSFTEQLCRQIPQVEQLCNDGEDNDEDCLTDLDDPDCLG